MEPELKIISTQIMEGQKLIVEGQKLISEYKTLITEDPYFISGYKSLTSEDQNLIVEGQKLIVEGQGKIWKARERLDNLIEFDCAEPSIEQLLDSLGDGPPITPPPYSSLKR